MLLGEFSLGIFHCVFMASLLPIKVPINEHKDTIDYFSRYGGRICHCGTSHSLTFIRVSLRASQVSGGEYWCRG